MPQTYEYEVYIYEKPGDPTAAKVELVTPGNRAYLDFAINVCDFCPVPRPGSEMSCPKMGSFKHTDVRKRGAANYETVYEGMESCGAKCLAYVTKYPDKPSQFLRGK